MKELFHSDNYSKRTYIRAFARLLDLLGSFLIYPEAISRNLGLALSKRIEEDASVVREIRARLSKLDDRTAADEIGVLRAVLDGAAPVAPVRRPSSCPN